MGLQDKVRLRDATVHGAAAAGPRRGRRRVFHALLSLTLLGAVGCAQVPEGAGGYAGPEAVNDPIEPLNRMIFAINGAVDALVLRPVTAVYRQFTPEFLQVSVTNVLRNLRAPVTLANDLLQGDLARAEVTASRFFVNSTVGFLGMGDPAAGMGLAHHEEDFGQTLGVWGAGEGFYLVLPLLGPSNPRDTVGIAVDYVLDPVRYAMRAMDADALIYARAGTSAVDARSRNWHVIDDVQRTSLDPYATMRSLYRQQRIDAIRNGRSEGIVPGPAMSALRD